MNALYLGFLYAVFVLIHYFKLHLIRNNIIKTTLLLLLRRKKSVKFDVVQAADPNLSTGGPKPPASRDTFVFTGKNQEVADALKSALLHFGAQHHGISGDTSN